MESQSETAEDQQQPYQGLDFREGCSNANSSGRGPSEAREPDWLQRHDVAELQQHQLAEEALELLQAFLSRRHQPKLAAI